MKPVKLVGTASITQRSLKIKGQAVVNGRLEFSADTLTKGKCTMVTSTRSDRVECDYEVNYSRIGPLSSLTLDILPMSEPVENTGNAFPGSDGWVFHDFVPTIPELFPTEDGVEWWRTLLIPRMSDFITFSKKEFADEDIWTATFHPEQAISLSMQSSGELFRMGDTWQITERLQFSIPSL